MFITVHYSIDSPKWWIFFEIYNHLQQIQASKVHHHTSPTSLSNRGSLVFAAGVGTGSSRASDAWPSPWPPRGPKSWRGGGEGAPGEPRAKCRCARCKESPALEPPTLPTSHVAPEAPENDKGRALRPPQREMMSRGHFFQKLGDGKSKTHGVVTTLLVNSVVYQVSHKYYNSMGHNQTLPLSTRHFWTNASNSQYDVHGT